MPMPLTVLPSLLSLGEKVTTAPIPGTTDMRPPETPDLDGIPNSFTNLPAPLYIPHVVMIVTTDCTVSGLRILSPVEGFTPLLASIAPNLLSDSTFTSKEQALKRGLRLNLPSHGSSLRFRRLGTRCLEHEAREGVVAVASVALLLVQLLVDLRVLHPRRLLIKRNHVLQPLPHLHYHRTRHYRTRIYHGVVGTAFVVEDGGVEGDAAGLLSDILVDLLLEPVVDEAVVDDLPNGLDTEFLLGVADLSELAVGGAEAGGEVVGVGLGQSGDVVRRRPRLVQPLPVLLDLAEDLPEAPHEQVEVMNHQVKRQHLLVELIVRRISFEFLEVELVGVVGGGDHLDELLEGGVQGDPLVLDRRQNLLPSQVPLQVRIQRPKRPLSKCSCFFVHLHEQFDVGHETERFLTVVLVHVE
eukprot:CAMPEP_0170553190 /NCGR_PEP_ID=MMETSP0211-20121228/10999_1 /TAXON_ID=311385 /ORGANISM="Pseudokeronopsis sp., Strain OXSARD2" /LENGTH=411 /DNA_ID=CAMNT_0010861341 /DNA_START=719 /DNA_END=1956 /DNA_ORIENTATION=-